VPGLSCSVRTSNAMQYGARKPFNPQPLISHLTNSNGCGNLQPKDLLTVSPFRPSFFPPLNLFPPSPRAISPLSTAFTPNRPLTPLSTAFTQKHRGCRVHRRLLPSQPSDFRTFRRADTIFSALCFHNLTNCFSHKSFVSITIRVARGVTSVCPQCSELSALCVALFLSTLLL